jgi:hypothetical protein
VDTFEYLRLHSDDLGDSPLAGVEVPLELTDFAPPGVDLLWGWKL